MPLSRELRRAIERSDFAAVEDEFLARLDEDPKQVEHFVLVARSLSGAGESERAEMLLELVDDQLVKSGDWKRRLKLLDGARELHPVGAQPHAQIVRTVEKMYEGQPSLAGFVNLVGLHKAVDDIPKTWEKVRRLQQLMQFEVGTVVAMDGKGVGRIVEVNTELASFKVDLDVGGEIRVGFKAAGKLLSALPERHFLRRKVESPEDLEQHDARGLLEVLLESYDRPLVASEIKVAVTGLVDPGSWNSWWTAARKHPQLVTEGAGAKRTYRWADTHAEAGAAVLSQFKAADLMGKLAIFRKEAGREPELGEEMSEHLIELGRACARSKPEVAFAIAAALEKAGTAETESRWSAEILILESKDPSLWIPKVPELRLRRAAAELVRRREDWAALFRGLIEREQDPKLLDYLAAELRTGDPQGLDELLDVIVAQARKYPAAFVWAAERISTDDLLEAKSPARLLQMITSIGERPEFSAFRPRLKQLIGHSDCLAILVGRVSEDHAKQTEEALRRAHLEEYQRERLTTALHLRFPKMRPDQAMGLYATSEAIEARRAELKELLEVEIPANRKAIEVAREHGDLRENFEYKSARARHEYLSARATEIDSELRRVRPIEFSTVDGSEVRVGATITLRGEGGKERKLTILGPWESQPEKDIVSYESDLATALLGKTVGDTVKIFDDELTIKEIAPAG